MRKEIAATAAAAALIGCGVGVGTTYLFVEQGPRGPAGAQGEQGVRGLEGPASKVAGPRGRTGPVGPPGGVDEDAVWQVVEGDPGRMQDLLSIDLDQMDADLSNVESTVDSLCTALIGGDLPIYC